jgi:myosin I
VTGFVDKNNDLLFRDLSQAMYRSSHPILKELFPEGIFLVGRCHLASRKTSRFIQGNPRRATLRRPATAGSQFKVSVNALMKNLSTKMPHYVRCIKPNDLKQANLSEAALVQHQVRYLGLMENVHVRRAGFAFRQTYTAFLQRYKMTSALTWPDWSGPSIEGVARLLRDLHISATEYAFGRTKIFIKNPRTVKWPLPWHLVRFIRPKNGVIYLHRSTFDNFKLF